MRRRRIKQGAKGRNKEDEVIIIFFEEAIRINLFIFYILIHLRQGQELKYNSKITLFTHNFLST
jgi:hypothetical protein